MDIDLNHLIYMEDAVKESVIILPSLSKRAILNTISLTASSILKFGLELAFLIFISSSENLLPCKSIFGLSSIICSIVDGVTSLVLYLKK